jgi:tight adherence protein B
VTGPPAAAAVALAAAAGTVALGDPALLLRRIRTAEVARVRRPRAIGPGWVLAPAALVLAWAVAGSAVLAASAGVATRAVTRSAAARTARSQAAARRRAAVDLVTDLADELRGGAEPRAALAVAARDRFAGVATAARNPASDPAAALRSAAAAAGFELLADLAAAWRVTDAAGAGLARPASRLAEAARTSEAVRRELDAQLAGPRATAQLLSFLPVAGVVLGTAMGADPVAFLVATGPGRVTLLAGTLLINVGLGWTEAIVRRADVR